MMTDNKKNWEIAADCHRGLFYMHEDFDDLVELDRRITKALDEKDLEMAQLEKDLVNARQELDALRIRSASE